MDNDEKRRKIRAREILNAAVGSGHVKKPDQCEECGSYGPLSGHHEDYSKALDVEWLCGRCHSGRHADDLTEQQRAFCFTAPRERWTPEELLASHYFNMGIETGFLQEY